MLHSLTLLALLAGPPDFDRDVAPILARRCLDCHAGPDPKGDLDLSSRKTAAPAVAGKPDETPLWAKVAADEMPPKKPLPAAEKAVLKAWLESGAGWGTDPIDPLARTTADRAGRDWWSLRPVVRPSVPADVHPIDHFVRAKLAAKGLRPAPPADPRALVRRVYFDLTGLPPPPEEIDAFAKDPSDAAYRALVDRLLASPHFGERWARHWLDVARYGESDGFERNAPRPRAWHYRDWVIAALNADLPYDEFARLQIAGDVLRPGDPAGVTATGFLVAGVHNAVLGANPVMNMTARQDELEDIVSAVGQTFLGLTVQCARCHDHKFDPVTQVDYYRVAAALGGVYHGERPSRDPAAEKLEADLRRQLREAERKLAGLEEAGRTRVRGTSARLAVTPLARWTFDADAADERGVLNGELKGGAVVRGGRLVLDGTAAHVVTAPLAADLREKTLEAWVTLAGLEQGGGGVVAVEVPGGPFDAIVYAERQPGKWIAGSEFFRRTQDARAAPETANPGELVHVAVAYHPDGRVAVYRNGRPYGEPYIPAGEGSDLQTFKAGAARVLLGKRHTGGNRPFLRGEIEEARLYDRALSADEVAASAKAGPGPAAVPLKDVLAALTAAERADRDALLAERNRLAAGLAAVPRAEAVFAAVPRQPPATHVLARGSVEQRREVVAAGGVAAVPGSADFGLPADAPEAARRAKLAGWVARADNPLFTRVIVNRLWHHHFGVGIVETPSDLGFNGGRPSHPELLDWLAAELVEPTKPTDERPWAFDARPWSLKHIHRLIVTSAAYRQSSAKDPAASARDADNRLLWRKSPTRLDAEQVRDAILAASGRLNPQAGGPGFADVRTYFNSGTTYYEPIDAAGPAVHRRTVYRFSPRGERSPLLDTFDCPDPSAQTPRRAVTTTPLQALALWNDSFVLRMADALAERAATDDPADPLGRAYRLALGRGPTADERKLAGAVMARHGLAAVCRVLFNCNEFVVIE